MSLSAYSTFLARKAVTAPMRGAVPPSRLAGHLFPFQDACVRFGIEAGSWGLFLDTGLGKTACELEWARHAAEQSNGYALIIAPLAVGHQIAAEAQRWGYDARVIRSQDEAAPGINICNYDRLHLLDAQAFGAVVLDESSILKSFTGRTSRLLIESFSGHRWRLSASATPAPNDHMELATQTEFVGAMTRDEMLTRFFVHDSNDTKVWRLKGHARAAFWEWMASWSRFASHPRDLGDEREGFDLPPLTVHRHDSEDVPLAGSGLFGTVNVSATEVHKVKRATAAARADVVAGLVGGTEPWIVWCDTNYEADALKSRITDAGEVRGSQSIEQKESTLDAFSDGSLRTLITKPRICGYGLNWQHCARMAFVGRSFSYESYYQAVRRCWRFGQTSPVQVHLIVAAGEDSIGQAINRKAADHVSMKREMVAAMRGTMNHGHRKTAYQPEHDAEVPAWL